MLVFLCFILKHTHIRIHASSSTFSFFLFLEILLLASLQPQLFLFHLFNFLDCMFIGFSKPAYFYCQEYLFSLFQGYLLFQEIDPFFLFFMLPGLFSFLQVPLLYFSISVFHIMELHKSSIILSFEIPGHPCLYKNEEVLHC